MDMKEGRESWRKGGWREKVRKEGKVKNGDEGREGERGRE